MKIILKISLILVAVTTVGTVLFGSFFYIVAERNLKREIASHLRTAAHSRKEHIDTYLNLIKMSVGELSKSVVIEEFLSTPKDDPGWIRAYNRVDTRLKNTIAISNTIKEFMLMDSSGRVVASSSEESMNQDRSNDAVFLGGRNGISIKDAYFSDMHDSPMMSVSAPVIGNKTGELLGVVSARVSLDDLWNITTSHTGMGRTGEVILANKYGYMITPSRFLKDTFLKKKLETKLYKMSLEPGDPTGDLVLAPDYRGVKIFGTYERIPEMQWSVLTKIDVSEAYAAIRKLKLAFVTMLILNPLVALLLGTLFSISITRPVNKLIKGMKIVGSGDLDYKVGSVSKDEIGELSRSFDTMARDLRMKSVSIETLNNEINVRKKVEAALEDNRIRYQTIYDSSSDAIMILLPGKGFADANPATLKLFGCTMEQFRSHSPSDLSPEYQPDGSRSDSKANDMVDLALKNGSNLFEWKHRRMDGKEFFATVLLTRMNIGDEQLIQAVVRDITEQKRAADLIAKAAKEWEVTFNSMAEGVSLHDLNFKIINANSTLCRMLGVNKKEIIGKSCFELFHGKDAPIHGCMLERSRLTGKEERGEIFEPSLNKWLAVSVSPIHGEKDEIVNFVHVVSDITEQKRLATELMQSEKLASLGRFAYGAAHEIKNPLGIILGGTEFLRAKMQGSDEAEKDTLSMVTEAVRRADAIINALVRYSDTAKLNIEKLDVKKVMGDVITKLKVKLEAQHVNVITDFDPRDISISADKEQLMQALGNVVLNSMDALPGGGDIRVHIAASAGSDGAKCAIKISDNGEGIPKDNLPNVFEPFFTTRRDKKQLGLGLTLARSIINSNKGSIEIESEKGKGTAVRISFPAA